MPASPCPSSPSPVSAMADAPPKSGAPRVQRHHFWARRGTGHPPRPPAWPRAQRSGRNRRWRARRLSPASAHREEEVGGERERELVRDPQVSEPAGGPRPFKWRRAGSKPASRTVKAYSTRAAFDVTPATRASEPLGRPNAYLPPCAQDKGKTLSLFFFIYFVKL